MGSVVVIIVGSEVKVKVERVSGSCSIIDKLFPLPMQPLRLLLLLLILRF